MPVTTVVHLTHLNVQEWMENSCRYPQFIKTHISYYKINISTVEGTVTILYIYRLSTKLHQKISWVSVLLWVHSTSNNANGNKYIVSSITSHVSYVWTSNEIGSLCNKIIFTIMTWKKTKKKHLNIEHKYIECRYFSVYWLVYTMVIIIYYQPFAQLPCIIMVGGVCVP